MTLALKLPIDLSNTNEEHELLSLDTEEIEQRLQKDLNNIELWSQLLNYYDLWINEKLVSGENAANIVPNEEKQKINSAYRRLLTRFPNLEEYWKKWSIVEFKLNGAEASINVLRTGVENFPHSVSLWSEYLAALKTTNGADAEKFRFMYREALKYNAYHFQSHPIWDKAIEFETEKSNSSNELRELYLQALKIPMYQYAQYYSQFSEISKNFEIQKLLDKETLPEYVGKFGKSKLEELSLIEKHQIIDDYFNVVFASTQMKVGAIWEYEQQLLNQDFSTDRSAIDTERKIWLEYLDKEITAYNASPEDGSQFNFVRSIFERALVPNCYDTELWQKYINFIESSSLAQNDVDGDDENENEKKFKVIDEIYKRANSRFVPLDQNDLRLGYVDFLVQQNMPSQANEYLFDWIKLFSGNSKLYLKKSYLEMVHGILNLWERQLSKSKFQSALESIVDKRFFKKMGNDQDQAKGKDKDQDEDIDMSDKTRASDSNERQVEDSSLSLSNEFTSQFTQFLNEDAVPLLVLALLTLYKSQKGTVKIRELFNKLYKERDLVNSIGFWRFMLEFEGLYQGNLQNLRSIYNFVKTETQLPKAALDAFSDWFCDFASANVRRILNLNKDSSDDTMIWKDLNTSNSVFYNKSIRKRQRSNNKLFRNQSLKVNEKDAHSRILEHFAKQAGHPGETRDEGPTFSVSVEDGTFEVDLIDLTKRDLPVPPYPTVLNTHKASIPKNNHLHTTKKYKH
ncbi:uncharacterized protein LODBEIA_P01790 [Lodderomyces beijingensis]|uniref:Suppressor of forked domain-containing protein n=1 Tax=Lodderomyces beijingensis TaxID=1775926 RepID=A0ABP0ZHY7_9ASCO